MQIRPSSAASSALSGILAAQRRLDEDADRIAQDPFDVEALVESTGSRSPSRPTPRCCALRTKRPAPSSTPWR